jgi:hypothetical protein
MNRRQQLRKKSDERINQMSETFEGSAIQLRTLRWTWTAHGPMIICPTFPQEVPDTDTHFLMCWCVMCQSQIRSPFRSQLRLWFSKVVRQWWSLSPLCVQVVCWRVPPQLCDVIVPPMIIGGSRSIRCSNDVSTIDHKCHDDVHQCRSIIPAKSVAVITEGPSVCSCLNLLHNWAHCCTFPKTSPCDFYDKSRHPMVSMKWES